MSPRARAVFRLFPRWWWRRYGAELEALVDETDRGWPTTLDLVVSALKVRVTQRAPRAQARGDPNPFCLPSGVLPLLMSLLAMSAVVEYAVRFGTAPQSDEGTAAHVWQLMMGCQLPIVLYFAVRWVPRLGRRAAGVTTAHLVAAFAAVVPVWWFGW
jgi:hypothetical protein